MATSAQFVSLVVKHRPELGIVFHAVRAPLNEVTVLSTDMSYDLSVLAAHRRVASENLFRVHPPAFDSGSGAPADSGIT